MRNRHPGHVGGRSAYLAWAAELGPDICPYFYMAKNALRVKRWRHIRAGPGGAIQRTERRNTMAWIEKEWEWYHIKGSYYETPEGVLSLVEDGEATIKAVATRAWEEHMWTQESRVNRDGPPERLREPSCEAHSKWLRKGPETEGVSRRRIALCSARHGPQVKGSLCRCGMKEPKREHWAWFCPETGNVEEVGPSSASERKLCTPCVQRPERGQVQRRWGPVPGLREEVQDTLGRQGRVIIATDGSSKGRRHRVRVARGLVAQRISSGRGAHVSLASGCDETLLSLWRARSGGDVSEARQSPAK